MNPSSLNPSLTQDDNSSASNRKYRQNNNYIHRGPQLFSAKSQNQTQQDANLNANKSLQKQRIQMHNEFYYLQEYNQLTDNMILSKADYNSKNDVMKNIDSIKYSLQKQVNTLFDNSTELESTFSLKIKQKKLQRMQNPSLDQSGDFSHRTADSQQECQNYYNQQLCNNAISEDKQSLNKNHRKDFHNNILQDEDQEYEVQQLIKNQENSKNQRSLNNNLLRANQKMEFQNEHLINSRQNDQSDMNKIKIKREETNEEYIFNSRISEIKIKEERKNELVLAIEQTQQQNELLRNRVKELQNKFDEIKAKFRGFQKIQIYRKYSL